MMPELCSRCGKMRCGTMKLANGMTLDESTLEFNGEPVCLKCAGDAYKSVSKNPPEFKGPLKLPTPSNHPFWLNETTATTATTGGSNQEITADSVKTAILRLTAARAAMNKSIDVILMLRSQVESIKQNCNDPGSAYGKELDRFAGIPLEIFETEAKLIAAFFSECMSGKRVAAYFDGGKLVRSDE